MRQHLERYTPEVCSHLRQIAERRNWNDWQRPGSEREELLEEMELTYHLHVAAEATGARRGMPPMPPFPFCFIDSEGILDPVEFLRAYKRRHGSPGGWNHSDNAGNHEDSSGNAHRDGPIRRWVAAACLAVHLL